jgi:cytochrome P450
LTNIVLTQPCFFYFVILGLSRTEITQEMLSFLTASYGTVSTALAWFIHLMSKHPRVQLKIKRELSEHNIQSFSAEQLDLLVYLDCVLSELFRFAPPLHSSLRTLTLDDKLPASGVYLKKGEQLFISIYNLGGDTRYWSGSIDPDQFYPERFMIEDQHSNDNRAASIPFGGGHRQCIGKDLARFQLKVICARLMQHVTFVDGGPKINSGGYKQTDTIIPKNMGVTITFDSELLL